jgi:GH24 family phage-related lysozyme (muramidase)
MSRCQKLATIKLVAKKLAPIVQASINKGAIRPNLERTMSRLTASRVAFDLIASFEGYRARAARAPDGRWTLGFGHTATAREGLTVTRNEAEDLLRWDLLPIEDTLRQVAFMPLSQNQFDALTSFAFNIGLENFKTSNVLKALNQGEPVTAALAMHAWRRARVNGQVLTIDALVRRRAAEAALFLETAGARPAAPTSVIRPQIDTALTDLTRAPPPPPIAHQSDVDAPVVPVPVEAEKAGLSGKTKASMPELNETSVLSAAAPIDADTQPPLGMIPALLGEPTSEAEPKQEVEQDPNQGQASTDGIDNTFKPEQNTATPAVPAARDVVLPAIKIAALGADRVTNLSKLTDLSQPSKPILPAGLSPFPGTEPPHSANGPVQVNDIAANDGHLNRLFGVPETIETPIGTASSQPQRGLPPIETTTPIKIQPFAKVSADVPALVWISIALGAGLLAFGAYISWQSGVFRAETPRVDLTGGQLAAMFAAASGFIILVTSAIVAFTGVPEEDSAATPKV